MKIQEEIKQSLILEIAGILAVQEGFMPLVKLNDDNPRAKRWKTTANAIINAIEKHLN
jgi:hypothetical protein